jgi:rubredoxin
MNRLLKERHMKTSTLLLAAFILIPAIRAADGPYGDISDVKLDKPEDKVDIKSTPPPKGALVLFDGKSLDHWVYLDGKTPARWKLVEGAAMEVHGGNIMTKEKFDGHFKLHVEFRVPYLPDKKDQARGNSGVYVQGRYEVQVLDSYHNDTYANGACGAIYEVAAPRVNACKAPTVWQSYDIEFTAPVCKDGKKEAPARMTVYQNGIQIHDNVAINKNFTRAGMETDPCTPGPIMLQDHGNPVQFRNVWLLPLK